MLYLDRVHHRTSQKKIHALYSDHIQHDGTEDLVDVKISLQRACNAAPYRPGQKSDHQAQGDDRPAGPVRRKQCDGGGGNCSSDQLSLAADIDHPAAKGDADSQAHKQEGGRFDNRVCQGVGATKRPAYQSTVGLQRVGAQC